MTHTSDKKQAVFYLTQQHMDLMDEQADKLGISRAEFLRRLLNDYFSISGLENLNKEEE